MKALINEIREYVNQEKTISRTSERLEHAMDMNRSYTSGREEQHQVDYFIGCVNQYTEVLSYGDVR